MNIRLDFVHELYFWFWLLVQFFGLSAFRSDVSFIIEKLVVKEI